MQEMISHFIVSSINPSYSTTTIQTKHKSGFYNAFKFKLRNKTHGHLTLSQWDDRLFPANSGYEYSPATLVLERNDPGHKGSFVNAGTNLYI